jgi:hypothetical protein
MSRIENAAIAPKGIDKPCEEWVSCHIVAKVSAGTGFGLPPSGKNCEDT